MFKIKFSGKDFIKNNMTKKIYKQIQLTNQKVGAVAVDEAMPLGLVTRRINAPAPTCTTFQLASSNADTLYLNEPGFYKVTYSASLTAGAVGDLTLSLTGNGTTFYTVQETVAADDIYNFTLPYTVRVCSNCNATPTTCPMALQVVLGGVAVTGTSSNLIVEKIQ